MRDSLRGFPDEPFHNFGQKDIATTLKKNAEK